MTICSGYRLSTKKPHVGRCACIHSERRLVLCVVDGHDELAARKGKLLGGEEELPVGTPDEVVRMLGMNLSECRNELGAGVGLVVVRMRREVDGRAQRIVTEALLLALDAKLAAVVDRRNARQGVQQNVHG